MFPWRFESLSCLHQSCCVSVAHFPVLGDDVLVREHHDALCVITVVLQDEVVKVNITDGSQPPSSAIDTHAFFIGVVKSLVEFHLPCSNLVACWNTLGLCIFLVAFSC